MMSTASAMQPVPKTPLLCRSHDAQNDNAMSSSSRSLRGCPTNLTDLTLLFDLRRLQMASDHLLRELLLVAVPEQSSLTVERRSTARYRQHFLPVCGFHRPTCSARPTDSVYSTTHCPCSAPPTTLPHSQHHPSSRCPSISAPPCRRSGGRWVS